MRARAAEVVHEVAYGGASLDAVLAHRAASFGGDDRALLKEMCYGTLRWYWRSRGIVAQLLRRPLKRRDRIIEALLLVGAYQLAHMRQPPHAAIHTTVDACTVLRRPGLKGLVNGVLRNYQRRGDALLETLPGPARDAHPEWLWHAIADQWPNQQRSIIEAANARPPMILRVNTRRGSVAAYLDTLRAAGLAGTTLEHAPAAVVLDQPVGVDRLPGFAEGRVSIQDASAQLLARIIDPQPGHRVLDACAAPGGKLTHMLEAFPGIVVDAVEADPERARRITENLARLQLASTVSTADAAVPDTWWDGSPYDLVVLDVPCSGTGVLRRHPDIKVLRRAADLDGFAAAQARLLDGLWPVLRPGGRLVYVTCSILARENQDQIESFVRRAADAREEPVPLPLGAALSHGRQILPQAGGGDGFFYAVLRRQAAAEGGSGSV